MKDAVGPGEAARRLGVSTRTVQRWLREGRLPSVQVGSHVKVDASALRLQSARTTPRSEPIRRLLVANRGELVVRIARTCRQLGITSLALVPEDQARAWWIGAADEIVPLRGTYLDADAVLAAALDGRRRRDPPGYGFLAENAAFAEAVDAAGITGSARLRRRCGRWATRPPRADGRAMGVPILPGYDGDEQSDARLAARRSGSAIRC